MKSDDIRKYLKQWDRWRYKVSDTPAILDREYADMTVEQFKKFSDFARMDMGNMLERSKDDIPYAFRPGLFDCDDYALLFQALFGLTWMDDSGQDKPAPVFRCIAETPDGPHAFNIGFTTEGIYFCEPQTGRIWGISEEKPKILAIT